MTIQGISQPAVPYGSLLVISGSTGFIGSHVTDQALAAGYRVRGTTRNVEKASWALEYFEDKYGKGKFELVQVEEMQSPNAFDGVCDGAQGFIHVAHDMSGSEGHQSAADRAISGALNAAKAAHKAGMKRFVYTSSSFAVTQPKPNVKFTITTDSWNDEAVEKCEKGDADGATIYSASKVKAERALFAWVKEHGEGMVVNSLNPNANLGPVLSPKTQGYPTTAGIIHKLYKKDYAALSNRPPEHYINVTEDAKLHIVALAHPDVQFERIFAIKEAFTFQGIIEKLREAYPEKKWEDFPEDQGEDLSTVEPSKRAEELLKEAYGHGFVDLLTTVKQNTEGLE